MNHFTPLSALIGGALIGLSASIFFLMHGRVAGISGLYGGLFRAATPDRALRFAFIAGLLSSGVLVRFVFPDAFSSTWTASLPIALVAGLLVGVGTQLGNGCTSGHGVCGISRLSIRSLIATVAFMAAGIATTSLVRHAIGGDG
jgi:uncharacterized membrane protein YedE/YeeE